VYSSGSSLLTIINDILDYSKFSTGKLALNISNTDIRKVTLECMNLFKSQAAEKDLYLYADIAEDVPTSISADSHRLRQMLINLLGNAIKFTPSGEVVIRITQQAENIIIEIIDSGPGIPKQQISSLFKAFEQLDPSISSRYGGTGLGLVITKQLAEAMHGSIAIENNVIRGSTFRLTLPLITKTTNTTVNTSLPINAQINAINLTGIRIMIATQSRSYSERLSTLCHSWGMDVSLCENIDQIYSQALNAALNNKPFGIFLLDLNTTNQSDIEVAKNISDKLSTSKPKIILISHASRKIDATLMQTAGISLQIEKPLILQQLSDIFNTANLGLSEASNEPTLLANIPQMPDHPINVLVVEDNKTNQLVIRQLLRRLGHRCQITENGEEGYLAYKSHGDSYDLILMDCEMPVMDGLEATRKIRQWEKDSGSKISIPIVALTAHALPEKLKECIDVGMNNCLTKPLMLNKLAVMLDTYCHTGVAHDDGDDISV
jgi:CheY-like chemotaxis protein